MRSPKRANAAIRTRKMFNCAQRTRMVGAIVRRDEALGSSGRKVPPANWFAPAGKPLATNVLPSIHVLTEFSAF
jgi:hypothetical protein